MDNESSPSLVDQDQGRPNGDQALSVSEAAERNPFAPTSPFVIAPQPLWDEEMHGANLPLNNLSQHFGTVMPCFVLMHIIVPLWHIMRLDVICLLILNILLRENFFCSSIWLCVLGVGGGQ